MRIDKTNLQPNQKAHAHFETPKGTGVVDVDGGESHGKKSNLKNLNKKMKDYLRSKGFKIPGLAPYDVILPLIQQYCALNPFDSACKLVPGVENNDLMSCNTTTNLESLK